MNIIETELPGVLLIEADFFGDARGGFMETFNQNRYREMGLDAQFVQDNLSFSSQGVLRGLHFQNPNAQGKLVQVLQGEVFDVAVDIRVGSPYFGKWVGRMLSDQNHCQLYVPEGFAHGFCVLSDTATFAYKCTNFYNPESEMSLRWDDRDIGIDWPIRDPQLSEKDSKALCLKDIPEENLPKSQNFQCLVC